MPSDGHPDYRYWCDNCIKRGCSCNIIDYKSGSGEEYRDDQDRLLPCVECWEDTEGFDVSD